MTSPRGRSKRVGILSLALIVAWTIVGLDAHPLAAAPSRRLPLVLVRDVALPGGTTRFDYQAIDSQLRRLYVAHLGDSTLDVIDLDTLRVVHTVPDIAGIHGVAIADDLGHVFATATGSDELVTIDATTDKVLSRTKTGDFPDGVTYDPDHKLAFVSNKNAGSITTVDAVTGQAIATTRLADEVGNVAYDLRTHLVYAATRTPERLTAINPTTRRVTAKIPLPGCDGAHGVYLDAQHQRAYVACENNARIVTVDLATRRATRTDTVGDNPDVLAYDPGRRWLYVAGESGTVTIFDTSRGSVRKIAEDHLAASAHSVAVDPTNHWVFFPLEQLHGRPTLRVMTPVVGEASRRAVLLRSGQAATLLLPRRPPRRRADLAVVPRPTWRSGGTGGLRTRTVLRTDSVGEGGVLTTRDRRAVGTSAPAAAGLLDRIRSQVTSIEAIRDSAHA